MDKAERAQAIDVDWGLFRAQRIAEQIALGIADEEAVAEARRAERRSKARIAWGLDLWDRIDAAQAAADAAWARLEAAHPELDEDGLDALPPPPEQEALDALLDQVDDLIERGRFPRHLHFPDV